jgi:hypothetical protein
MFKYLQTNGYFKPSSSNKFLQYLYKNKLNNVIQYLITAKKCEDVNSFEYDDPWERGETKKN